MLAWCSFICVCVCVAGGVRGCVLKWFKVLPSAAASHPLPSLWFSHTHIQWYVGLHLLDAISWLWRPSLLWSRLLLTELAAVRLHRKVWGCPSLVYMICIMCVNPVLLWPSKTSVVWKKRAGPLLMWHIWSYSTEWREPALSNLHADSLWRGRVSDEGLQPNDE